MELPKNPDNVTKRESLYRKLSYAESFKTIVATNPRLLRIFQDLEKKMKEKIERREALAGSFLEDGGVKITLIEKKNTPHPKKLGSYFKVEMSGIETFFVKTVPGFYDVGKGAHELASLKRAKVLLKGLENVEVVNFQLGYEDNHEITYFVSKWEKGVILDDYISELESGEIKSKDKESKELELSQLRARFQEIKRTLQDGWIVGDVHEHNILYDPITKKMTVFDVH